MNIIVIKKIIGLFINIKNKKIKIVNKSIIELTVKVLMKSLI